MKLSIHQPGRILRPTNLRTTWAQTFSFSMCVYMCICMCVHVYRCVLPPCMLGYRPEIDTECRPPLLPYLILLTYGVFLFELGLVISSRQSRQQDRSILLSLLSRTGVIGICSHACILYHGWNKNQDPHACEAGPLPIEPFPQLPSSSF